jgi:hypothetical protein
MKTAIFCWVLRLTVAVILLQTLFFKFTASEESVYIFAALGMEPYGRIGIGLLELVVVVLIVIPRSAWIGALLGCGVMAGAILGHILVLGLEVKNDGGALFIVAVIAFLCCGILFVLKRNNLMNWLNKIC